MLKGEKPNACRVCWETEKLKKEEFIYKQANKLRHPIIFYYAHTAIFFINKLKYIL